MSPDADWDRTEVPDAPPHVARPGESTLGPSDGPSIDPSPDGGTAVASPVDPAGVPQELPGLDAQTRRLADTMPIGRPPGTDGTPGSTVTGPDDKTAADKAAGPLRPGRELGPVRLIREIGRGGMGTVYRGHDRVLGRDVAVKFLRDAVAPDASAVARFVDEMRAAAAVRHPNLVPIFHADVDAEVPYLVMEYVDGPTLRRLVDRTGALPVELALLVLADIAAAVAALHERGLLHRDLKPANVLIDDDGHARVTDFGLAARLPGASGDGGRWTSGLGAAAGEAAGTPLYMAPELFDGRASPRSDVYALGLTAFEVLTGRRPFAFDRAAPVEEVRAAHASRPLPVEWLAEHGVPAALADVLERACHKQAMFRFKSAQEFLRAVKSAGGAAADAPAGERARARARLCRVVLRCQINASPDGQAPAGAGGAVAHPSDPASPASSEAGSGSGSGSSPTPLSTPTVTPAGTEPHSAYAETLGRIAAAKREVRARAAPLPMPGSEPPARAVPAAIRLPQSTRPVPLPLPASAPPPVAEPPVPPQAVPPEPAPQPPRRSWLVRLFGGGGRHRG